jgi:hypothetical protein
MIWNFKCNLGVLGKVPFAGTQQQLGSALQHAFAQPFSSQLHSTR